MVERSPRGQYLPFVAAVLAGAALPAWAAGAAPARALASAQLHAWEAGDDPGALEAWVHERLRRADADIGRLLAVKSARTVGNTLRPYDDAANELMLSVAQSSVLYGVGATKELRDKAQALTQTANAAYTALSLNQPVYRALWFGTRWGYSSEWREHVDKLLTDLPLARPADPVAAFKADLARVKASEPEVSPPP